MNPIRTHLGITPIIGKRVLVDESAVIIGDVHIGDDSAVWPLCVIRGDMNHIRIGSNTNIQDGSILHITHDGPFTKGGFPLIIGSNITIGHKVVLHGCKLEDNCFIGMDSIVMDGAIIESNVMVGAGSLVSPGKILKSGYLYVGRPAKMVRALTEEEIAFISYSANNYCKLKNQYLSLS